MKIGYARVSTSDQTTALQLDALTAEGCDHIYVDELSGARKDRPELEKALALVRGGDVLVIWKLDRLGRSLSHLIEIADRIREQGGAIKCLTQSIDTTTAGGKLFFHMLAAISEFERGTMAERIKEGMAASTRRGGVMGRPKKLGNGQLAIARKMLDNGDSVSSVAREFDISRTTLYEYLKDGTHE